MVMIHEGVPSVWLTYNRTFCASSDKFISIYIKKGVRENVTVRHTFLAQKVKHFSRNLLILFRPEVPQGRLRRSSYFVKYSYLLEYILK